jgi:5-oxoprolinase (ATP-hydrolysing) subunit A
VPIDLNADVGEGFEGDDALLGIVTSASVACGAHAGDAETMERTCAAAGRGGVRVGAHVAYEDREGFGRRALDVAPAVLAAQVGAQIAALAAFGAVRFVKPHGALYHRAAADPDVARVVVEAAGGLPVIGPPGSALLAAAGPRGMAEGFADRAYAEDGTLVDRSQPGALLCGEAALEQARRLAHGVDTICVHGDTPGAVELARAVRAALEAAGVDVRPFT